MISVADIVADEGRTLEVFRREEEDEEDDDDEEVDILKVWDWRVR